MSMPVNDTTEGYRRVLAAALNATGLPEAYRGPVWNTEELQRDFEVLGFLAPYVVVRRRSDGAKGSLSFVHSPRLYFDFQEVSS
jgi:hypothetical protein